MRITNNNLASPLLKALTLLTFLFASSITLANSCADDYWADGQWYDEGDTVEFNGDIYTAANDNPGYNPEASPWYWDWQSTAGSCGYQRKIDTSCVNTPWTDGQWYDAGDKVSFDGSTYIATVDNPGYNPTISTFFWNWVTSNDATCNNNAAAPADHAGGQWHTANITTFSSYPDPNEFECPTAENCPWMGQFKALPEKKSASWVQNNNIVAVHSDDYEWLKGKNVCIQQNKEDGGVREIKAKVVDSCDDSDCAGCCSTNRGNKDTLIDLERYTMKRFGSHSGEVKWKICN